MNKLECKRCGHTWIRRMEKLPAKCPKCTSPYWDKERKNVKKEKTNSEEP